MRTRQTWEHAVLKVQRDNIFGLEMNFMFFVKIIWQFILVLVVIHNKSVNSGEIFAEMWLALLQVGRATSAATFSVAPLLFKIDTAATSAASILTTFNNLFPN